VAVHNEFALFRRAKTPTAMRWARISAVPSTAHAVAFDLRPDSSFDFILEPPAYQIHYWQEEIGFVSHVCFIGDFGGRHPFNNSERQLGV